MLKFPFIPHTEKFFELFEASAQNMVKAAEQLDQLVDKWENVGERVAEITELEHRGDTTTHQILSLANRTFVTPFDREDIAVLLEIEKRSGINAAPIKKLLRRFL